MAFNNASHLTELAAFNRAGTLAAAEGFTRFKGMEDGTKTLPSITFTAEASEPVVENQANRLVTLAITIRTNMDDTTDDAHRDAVQEFLDLFFDDDLAAELTAANADFTCLGFDHLGESTQAIDRSFETTARLQLHVLANDLV